MYASIKITKNGNTIAPMSSSIAFRSPLFLFNSHLHSFFMICVIYKSLATSSKLESFTKKSWRFYHFIRFLRNFSCLWNIIIFITIHSIIFLNHMHNNRLFPQTTLWHTYIKVWFHWIRLSAVYQPYKRDWFSSSFSTDNHNRFSVKSTNL